MKAFLIALVIGLLLSPSTSFAENTEDPTQKRQQQLREMNDRALAQYIANGMDPKTRRNIAFVLSSVDKAKLDTLRERLAEKGQTVGDVWLLKKDDKGSHYVLEIIFTQTLADGEKLLTYSQLIDDIAKENQVQFIGWAAAKVGKE